ncbi:MAG: tRNA-dihydrouridine synthase family protein [Nanoarchaeota archaeon]|nr:tRNA-dihydrouridine synthase family protein [Nanoarchaeota archaeon]
MKTLKISTLKVNPILLAPMVDVTDLPYRLLCKEQGAGIVYTEMLHVEAIKHGEKKVHDKMRFDDKERPIGIQITFSELNTLKEIIPRLKDYDLVDINCGCPSHLTIDHGSGVCLMNSPEKVASAIKLLKKSGIKIVTLKIRLGFKKNNAVEFAKAVEKAGADAITVHGRLGNQGRSTPADWKEIEKVKKAVKIPVIGNGDVVDGKNAERLLEFCDGIMIARGAIGDPGIFHRINNYLKTKKEEKFDFVNNIKLFKKYLGYCEEYNLKDVNKIKYIGPDFIKGIKGASKLRAEFTKLKTFEEIRHFIEQF